MHTKNHFTESAAVSYISFRKNETTTHTTFIGRSHGCRALFSMTSPQGECFARYDAGKGSAADLYPSLSGLCFYLCVPPPCYAVRIKDGCSAYLFGKEASAYYAQCAGAKVGQG